MNIRLAAAIALSLSGGVIAWAGSRRMLRHAGDPLFADHLFAHRVAMIRIYLVLLVAIGFAMPSAAFWLAWLLFLSIAIGGFPARRTLYDERWTLAQYLANRVRLIAFAGGAWIAIMTAPQIVLMTGPVWAIPVFLVAVTLWIFQQELILFGFGSERLRDEALLARLEPILGKMEAPRPAIYAAWPDVGRFVNAFALPNGRRSRVVLTRPLLRELTPDEVAAVFGHEAAHLEQYAKRGMRVRMRIGALLLPLFAIAPEVMLIEQGSEGAKWFPLVWPLAMFFAIAAALVRRRRHEAEADLRALQLGADPQALIGGLEKLHRLNRSPRRYDASREKRMSHPSLARRIQAIRSAAGLPAQAAPQLPRVIAAKTASLRFTTEALEIWSREPSEGLQPDRSYRYDSLQSLVLRKTLRAWELTGRRAKEKFRFPIAPEPAFDVQTILDSIDVHFAQPKAAAESKPASRASIRARLLAVITFLVTLLSGIPFPPLVAAIVAFFSRRAAALAALGATAMTAGLAGLTQHTRAFREPVTPALMVVEVALGIVSFVAIRFVTDDKPGRHLRATLITLGVFLLLAVVPPAVAFALSKQILQLHLAVRSRPSLFVLLTGMAAALAVAGRRRMATVPALAAIALIVFGGPIGTRLGADPLLTDRQPAWVRAPRPSAVRVLTPAPAQLRLSPGGGSFAVRMYDPEEDDQGRFAVATMTSPLHTVAASDLEFVSEDRLLRLDSNDVHLEVGAVDVGGNVGGWKLELPQLWNPELAAGDDGEWRVAGFGPPHYQKTVFRGRIDGQAYTSDAFIDATVARVPRGRLAAAAMMFSPGLLGTEFRRVRNGTDEPIGRSVFASGSAVRLPGSDRWALVASDDHATYVGVIRENSSSIERAGMVPAHAFRVIAGRGSRIVLKTNDAAYVWNLDSGKAMRIGCSRCEVLDVALSDRAAGVLTSREEKGLLMLYPTDILR